MSDFSSSNEDFDSDDVGSHDVVYAVSVLEVTGETHPSNDDGEDTDDDEGENEEVQQVVAKVCGKIASLKSQLRKSRQENRILELKRDELTVAKATIASLEEEQKRLIRVASEEQRQIIFEGEKALYFERKARKKNQKELKKSKQTIEASKAALEEATSKLKQKDDELEQKKQESKRNDCSAMILSLMTKIAKHPGAHGGDLDEILRKAASFVQSERTECPEAIDQVHQFLSFCSEKDIKEVSKKSSQEIKARWYGRPGPLSSHRGIDLLLNWPANRLGVSTSLSLETLLTVKGQIL